MLHATELRGFSRDERDAARAQYQKSVDALDYFERKLDVCFLDPRLCAESARFLKRLWYGVNAEGEMTMASRAIQEAHAKAMILSHIQYGRGRPGFMNGDTRARLITLCPSVGIEMIEAMTLPLKPLRGFADRAARKVNVNALYTLDLGLFCPNRGARVDIVGHHVQGTVWSRDRRFNPIREAKRIGDAFGTRNSLDAKVAVIKTRGWSSGNTLAVPDVAGLGWYASKLSCGVNTCYTSNGKPKSENSHTGWEPEHALRQLEVLSHTCLFDACWAVGEGQDLRMLWRNRVLNLLGSTVGGRSEIPHRSRTRKWAKVWSELNNGYRAITYAGKLAKSRDIEIKTLV